MHGARWKLVRNAPGASVVISRNQEVLLGLRAREPWRDHWEVPSGFVDLGEHPADAARREVKEELGVDVALTAFLGIYLERLPDGQWVQTAVYVGESEGIAVPDRAEVLECRWFGRHEIPQTMAGEHRRRIDDWLAGKAVPLPAGL